MICSCRLPRSRSAIWIYLVFARGGFWLCRERDDGKPTLPAVLPPVAIVVPARNEADNIAQSVTSLLRQDYPALLASCWSTTTATTAPPMWRAAPRGARRAGPPHDRDTATRLPHGWTGKLWAVKQGIAAAEEKFAPKYLLLTDADIVHAPDTLSWLVAHAEAQQLVLTSLMARWRCENLRRARAHPGLHLLLRDALSVRLGEPAGSPDGGRGRRLHAGARGCAARRRRHRRHPRCADRRLRARGAN